MSKKAETHQKSEAGRKPGNRRRQAQGRLVALIVAGVMALSLVAYYFASFGPAPASPGSGSPAAAPSGGAAQGDRFIQDGNRAYDAGDYDGAIRAYEQALPWRGKDPGVLTDLGTAYFYRTPSDPARAASYYDRALAIDPSFPNALFNKGVVLFQGQGDATGAIAVWEKLLTVLPAGDPAIGKVKDLLAEARASLNAPSGPAPLVPQAPGARLRGGFGR